MPSPYLIIGFLIALAVVGFAGERVGERLNDQAWQKREASINAATAAKIQVATDAVRKEEQAKAQKFVDISSTLQGKLKDSENARTIALNAVRDGTGRLFVTASCPATSGDSQDSITASTSGSDAAGRTAVLGEADSAFLITEASHADKVVLKLQACQDIVRADRK